MKERFEFETLTLASSFSCLRSLRPKPIQLVTTARWLRLAPKQRPVGFYA